MIKALDLFCGAGGVTYGLQHAGFHVTGVDLKRSPRYVGDRFVQADALKVQDLVDEADFIWASPPCQAHTAMRTMHNAKKHEDLIGPTREMLIASGKPYVIENVIGAPLIRPFMLCGTMFGLGTADGTAELRRHRIFETNFPVLVPQCRHGLSAPVIGLYGGHVRNRKRTIGIYGEGARDSRRKMDKGVPDFSVDDGRYAMGISWMTIAELSQAIPPSYSKFIAESWLRSRALVAEEVTA